MDDEGAPIDLARLDEAMFTRLYEQRIGPCFAANEQARLAAIASLKRRALAAGGVTLVLALAAWAWKREANLAIITAFFGMILGFIYAYQPLAHLSAKLKNEYCTALARAIGATFHVGGFAPPAFERFKALRLLPGHDRSRFEDLFQGEYKGSDYALYEGRLEQRRRDSKGRTSYANVFRGQLIRMHFPRSFLGTTIVRRDGGVLNMFGGAGRLERVGLEDPNFERVFEVWGSDQVEARYLLHPVMMERLLELEQALNGRRLRCAFEGGDLLIAVEGGNLFEPGNLFKPPDPARARRIVEEIAGLVRVMDHVLGAQARRPA